MLRLAVIGLAMCLAVPSFAQTKTRLPATGINTDADMLRWAKEDVKSYDEAWNRRDLEGVLSFFEDNSMRISPRGPVRGIQEVRADIEASWSKLNSRNHHSEATDAHVSGNDGWATGQFSTTLDLPDKPNTPIKGNWLAVYDRIGDQWKARVQIFNFAPPPTQTSSAKQ